MPFASTAAFKSRGSHRSAILMSPIYDQNLTMIATRKLGQMPQIPEMRNWISNLQVHQNFIPALSSLYCLSRRHRA